MPRADQLMEDEASALFAAVRKTVPADQVAELRAPTRSRRRTDPDQVARPKRSTPRGEAVVDAASKQDRSPFSAVFWGIV